MIRRRRPEVHVNHERWLVSYADFITLLFAFFVVMYSISQVNESKYRVLSSTFANVFQQPSDNQIPSDANAPPPTSSELITPIDLGSTTINASGTAEVSPIVTNQAASSVAVVEENKELDEFTHINNEMTEKFSDLINGQAIKISGNEHWLKIEFSDEIVFSLGGVDLNPQAKIIFKDVAAILKKSANPIQVEGYTDNVPVRSTQYPSNWELSAARASSIVRYLMDNGVAPDRLAAVGYSQYQPLVSNQTEIGRLKNRRVTIMVAKHKLQRPE
jgi:chemotaxis protein MotB